MNSEKRVIIFNKPISILSYATAVGKMESQGPLNGKFDKVFEGDMDGESSFEKAESKMQLFAAKKALEKCALTPSQIDLAFAGDLLNQCIGSNYGLRSLNIPFIGLYGACSTMAESLAVASVFLSSGYIKTALAVTSSHFCAAERQFRLPIEYGGQRPLTSQWTTTAAGAIVLNNEPTKNKTKIKAACIGKIVDYEITNMNNMGAAMAPAAADTLIKFFSETETKPCDYDLILTGDLGQVGSTLLSELLDIEGFPLKGRHKDCGLLIYEREAQDVHAGGSGCGCSAAVLCADILDRLEQKELNKILFIATGALMSPTANQQGESIPGIAHLILLERD